MVSCKIINSELVKWENTTRKQGMLQNVHTAILSSANGGDECSIHSLANQRL